jgi:hypothetical protein
VIKTSADIDHLDCIAAQGSNEQFASAHSKVIKTSFGVLEGDGFRQHEWPFMGRHRALDWDRTFCTPVGDPY